MIEREFDDGTRTVSVEHPDGATEVTLEVDGRAVSRTYVVPMLMRIGAAVVRMDGIGGVETEEAYRNRGYSRRVMETCVEKMRAGDAAISMLYGIPDFYPKYGYATTGPAYTVNLPLDEDAASASLPPGWRVRPFAADDLPTVKRLYHAYTRQATGPLMRHDGGDELEETRALARSSPAARKVNERAWHKLENVAAKRGEDGCRVVLDESGAIVAYVWQATTSWWINHRQRDAPNSFHLGEVVAGNPAAADAVLVACRLWASEVRSDFEQIEMVIPPEGSVASAAAYEGAVFVARHTRRGEFMGRVLEVGRLLRQLRPELAARVRAARVEFRGELTFRTDEGEASLFITPDDVAVENGPRRAHLIAELPQSTLASLCAGAYETADLLARLPSPPQPEVASLLDMLFPRRFPHIYPVDRF